MKYDEIRDDSFDFLSIGEDDTEDYDDFVWTENTEFKKQTPTFKGLKRPL